MSDIAGIRRNGLTEKYSGLGSSDPDIHQPANSGASLARPFGHTFLAEIGKENHNVGLAAFDAVNCADGNSRRNLGGVKEWLSESLGNAERESCFASRLVVHEVGFPPFDVLVQNGIDCFVCEVVKELVQACSSGELVGVELAFHAVFECCLS